MELYAGLDVWSDITKLAKQAKDGRRKAAVAYLGKGGFTLLPMGVGDVLVVDCSERSAAAGVTNPWEVEKYLKAGVEVYRWEGLHAKVFVLGNVAVVGSANISRNSKFQLNEAAIVVTTKSTVRDAAKYIDDLCLTLVDSPLLRRCKLRWRPPRFIPRTPGSTEGGWSPIPADGSWRLWWVPVRHEKMSGHLRDRATEHDRAFGLKARAPYALGWCAHGEEPRHKPTDVLMLRSIARNGGYVSPPALVQAVFPVQDEEGGMTYITRLMKPRGLKWMRVSAYRRACPTAALGLIDSLEMEEKQVRRLDLKGALVDVWPDVRAKRR